VLRANPSFLWAWSNGTDPLPDGAAPVLGGTFQGLPAAVCRARHPTLGTGPHAG
jgi:hypothetical protein